MDASDEHIRKIQIYQRQTTTGRRALYFHQHDIHAIFDELIHRPWGRVQWNPPVDIREDEKAFVIEVDLPGVSDTDVRVRAEGRTLKIEGRRRLRPCDDDCTTHVCERPDGEFVRRFEFRDEIQNERIQSRLQNGVLTVTVTKPADE